MEEKLFDKQAFIQAMSTNPRANDFFTRFEANKEGISTFLNYYADHKKKVAERGNKLSPEIQYWKDQAKEMAWLAYKIICRRKIFIAQCLWRAYELKIPEVGISYEFWVWGENPLHCSFIEPATSQELELMKSFLLRKDFRKWDLNQHNHGQQYDEYVETEEERKQGEPGEYPLWYTYCDEHLDEPDWRALPNLKGEKEQFYMEAVPQSTPAHQGVTQPPTEEKQSMSWYDQEQYAIKLAEEMGDQKTAQYMKDRIYTRKGQTGPDVDAPQRYLEVHQEEMIAIPADAHWATGLNRSAEMHQARKAAEMLDEVHEEYIYRRANNILPPKKTAYMQLITSHFQEDILQGRKHLGEPEDFNY